MLVIMTLPSCEEEVPEVSFRINAEGFTLEEAILDPADNFPSFSHKLSGGLVIFSNGGEDYVFTLTSTGIDDYLFTLPVGEYSVDFRIAPASLYGQWGGSFMAEPVTVVVTESTEVITVPVEAKCAMFLVTDESDQLDDGIYIIERHSYAHGYFKSYPLLKDSATDMYYAYFTPDTVPDDPSAFLWFYEGEQGIEEGGLPTKDFEIGYQYNIMVLE